MRSFSPNKGQFFIRGCLLVPTWNMLRFFNSIVSGKLVKKLSAETLKLGLSGNAKHKSTTTLKLIPKSYFYKQQVLYFLCLNKSPSHKENWKHHSFSATWTSSPPFCGFLGIYFLKRDFTLKDTMISSTAWYSSDETLRKLPLRLFTHGCNSHRRSIFFSWLTSRLFTKWILQNNASNLFLPITDQTPK